MSLTVTILGCGSSGGVPRVGGDWGICDPNEPKNRRSRCSILVEKTAKNGEKTTVIVDTSPDLREQLLRAGTQRLDAVVFTHDHADQTHGIDDVRAMAYRQRNRIPVYMDEHTKNHLFQRFNYIFEMPEGRVHPPIMELKPLFKDGDRMTIEGPGGNIIFEALELSHGPTPSFGFKINDKIVYSPDVWDIPQTSFDRITGVDVWITDALRYNEHPTHAHADRTLAWAARAKPSKLILTNMHIDMDYATLSAELPALIDVAYDGMTITV